MCASKITLAKEHSYVETNSEVSDVRARKDQRARHEVELRDAFTEPRSAIAAADAAGVLCWVDTLRWDGNLPIQSSR